MVLPEIPKDSFVSYLFQAKLGLEVRDGVMYLVRRRYGLRGPGTKGEPSIPGIIIMKKTHTRWSGQSKWDQFGFPCMFIIDEMLYLNSLTQSLFFRLFPMI